MVASKQVEIPFYRDIDRQRGRRFVAFAQVIGRTTIPFSRKYIVPAANRVGADLLEFAVPEIADVVSGGKYFKASAKSVGRQTLRKQLGSGSRKRFVSRVIATIPAKQTNRSRRDISTNVSQFLSSFFWYQTLKATSGNLGVKVPIVDKVLLSQEQEIHPTTSCDKIFMKFEIQMDRSYYVDSRQTF